VLEALNIVRAEYGLAKLQKPCVAYVLDGNLGGASRHEAAFVVALVCRSLGLTEADTNKVLVKWAKEIGYTQNLATKATKSAYKKKAGGGFQYFAPGLRKKPDTVAGRVLGPICETLGCPANCPAYKGVYVGPKGEDYQRFVRLGWPEALRRARRGAAANTYEAICELERKQGFAAGATIIASTTQFAELSGHSRRHVPENLLFLYKIGLLCVYAPGGGSGPSARDRKATTVARVVPIPEPDLLLLSQYKTGDLPAPCIGDLSSPNAGQEPGSTYREPEVDSGKQEQAKGIADRQRPPKRRRKGKG
jgi:hypothetical protein